jgi:hypothetical protein
VIEHVAGEGVRHWRALKLPAATGTSGVNGGPHFTAHTSESFNANLLDAFSCCVCESAFQGSGAVDLQRFKLVNVPGFDKPSVQQ